MTLSFGACRAQVVPSRDISTTNLIKLDASRVSSAYVCYLEPNFTNARFITRRLRQIPAARIVFGLWSLSEHDIAEAEDAVRNIGPIWWPIHCGRRSRKSGC